MYLPENDFVFPIVVEELGFVGGRPALATTSLYPRTKIERPKPGRNWPQRGSFLAGRGPGPPSA